MIKSFRHKGLETFFRTGSKAGIRPDHADRLRKLLFALDLAKSAQDLDAPGWHLHQLSGRERGCWSLSVSGNWRVVFRLDEVDAELVDYLDYH